MTTTIAAPNPTGAAAHVKSVIFIRSGRSTVTAAGRCAHTAFYLLAQAFFRLGSLQTWHRRLIFDLTPPTFHSKM
jgi:hypothetical protein